MRRGLLAFAASVVIFATVASFATAQSTTTVGMRAHLKVVKLAATTVPNASGGFRGTLLRYSSGVGAYRRGRGSLTWNLSYQNLSSRATSAWVVVPASGPHSRVTIGLCAPCRASSHGVVKPIPVGSTTALMTRKAYVVVSTKKNRAGEIRGLVARSG
jgi:hypothetical protein